MRRRSFKDRFEDKFTPEPMSGCWLWTAYCSATGYGQFGVDNTTVRAAHRVSYELYVGKIPDGMDVLHRCDVRCCVNPKHLFLGTQLDNIRDMVAKGRQAGAPGEANAESTLTNEKVLAIRADKRPRKIIASDYGIDKTHVWRIQTRKSWAHI